MSNNFFLSEKRPHESGTKHVSGYANYIDDIIEPEGTLHGAIGYTWDYDLQIYTRKMQHQKLAFGDYNYHHKKISKLLNLT